MHDLMESVLVVDDNEAERYYVSRVLSKAGFAVREAATGLDALRLVEASLPALITLDIRLPDVSGLEVCRRLKQNPVTRDVPVLHISASFTSPENKAEGLEGGADGYLTHPVDANELVATVRSLLRARQAEVQLRAAVREIEAVYASAPVGLCVLDDQLRYVRLNQRVAEMIGHPVEALVGRTVRETTPAVADEVEPKLRHLLATGEAVHGLEVRGVTDAQPGVERVWVATWLPLRSADGRITGINIAAEEVTETRRLQEKLIEAHRLEAVGKLAGGVAHETNNQMTVVLGCAGFVLRHPSLPAAVRTDLEQIRQAADRTARITAQLLAYGRRQHLQTEVVDLDVVIDRLRPFLARALGDRCLLETQPGSRGHRVKADIGQVEQMLLNLTLNARDAMPDGGALTIRTGLVTVPEGAQLLSQDEEIIPGEYVSVLVADTGHGMTPAVLRRAFEPFFTTKGAGRGTGLGLSMVYGLVKQSGGYIRAESEPESGTRIEIFLPVVDAGVPLPPEAPAPSAGPVSAYVLVVEDDPLVRTVVVRELVAQGYRVAEAPDGVSALDRVTAEPFDLLVTDLAMPRMDGRELADRVAEIRPGLPVLFMSGHPDENTRRALAEADRPYLQKPFTPEELHSCMAELLRRPS